MNSLTRAQILHSLRYLQNPRLILSVEEIGPELAAQLPGSWLDLLSADRITMAQILILWEPFKDKLPGLLKELERTLKGFAILLEDDRPSSLLYLYTGKGKLYHHRGFSPLVTSQIPHELRGIWSRLPKDFRDLYSVHNGWFFLYAESMGHLSVEDLFLLSDESWDLTREELDTLPVTLDETLAFFANGGGDYLCIELTDQEREYSSLIWWSDEAANPELNINLWAAYDAWAALHFEQMDSR